MLKQMAEKNKTDILKSNKQIIISVACFLYDIVPFFDIIVLLNLSFLFLFFL